MDRKNEGRQMVYDGSATEGLVTSKPWGHILEVRGFEYFSRVHIPERVMFEERLTDLGQGLVTGEPGGKIIEIR
jgi:hypothetical protein